MERLHVYRREDIERFPVEKLCHLLSGLHYPIELLQNVREHAVTGDVFLQLSDEQLKEIAPKLGDRVPLKKLQAELLTDVSEKASMHVDIPKVQIYKFKNLLYGCAWKNTITTATTAAGVVRSRI